MIIGGKIYRELRCNGCRKFVIWEYVFAGRAYFKCPRCDKENFFEFKHLKTSDNLHDMQEFEINNKKLSPKGGE